MKTKTIRCTKAEAARKAMKLGLKIVAGGKPGSICRWTDYKREIVFVPDNSYTSEGVMTIRGTR